jgi:CubicO group peptidase (beta-lactamase class C family)
MRIAITMCLMFAGLFAGFGIPGSFAESPRKKLIQAAPETVGLRPEHLKNIDKVVADAIKAGEIPGAVVLVARHGRIAYCRAFGNRAVRPVREAMTADTIFDVASLTKVLATAPSIMLLVENGDVRLDDKVKRYLPDFTGGGKDTITVRHLLTHYSGLPADFDLSKEWFGYAAALQELWKIKTDMEPGKEFKYSDLNYIALGELVRSVSGKSLDAFAREHIFIPLDMTDTGFLPSATLQPRIAPTESRGNALRYLKGQASKASMDQILRGEVHDPTTWRMEGVAGHAGLFSSARDIAVFAQMLLDGGTLHGARILSPMTVQAMTRPQSPTNSVEVRGFGWDLGSSYSSPQGDLFEGGFGHTGFTGTSLWIHPPTDTSIVILSNRLHPDGGKDINHLRGAVANIVAAAIFDLR